MDEQWYQQEINKLSEIDKNNIFKMFIDCYKDNAWFSDKNVFYHLYKRILYYKTNNMFGAYLMLRQTSVGIKIVLIAHNNSQIMKQIVMNKLAQLLVTPGYYMEASEAVSHILKSRYNIFPIDDIEKIKIVLSDYIDRGDVIIKNENYKIGCDEEVYTRTSKKVNGVFKSRLESLYGIPCVINKENMNVFKHFVKYKIVLNKFGLCSVMEQ